MMGTGISFTLKSLLVRNIFRFLSWIFGHIKEWLDWKDQVSFTGHDPQSKKQTTPKDILCINSRRKSNHTMKFGQLIEYNMKINFPEKSYTKYGGESILRSFCENRQNRANLWINSLKFVFIVCKVEGRQNILKLSCGPPASSLFKAFSKIKKSYETSLRTLLTYANFY